MRFSSSFSFLITGVCCAFLVISCGSSDEISEMGTGSDSSDPPAVTSVEKGDEKDVPSLVIVAKNIAYDKDILRVNAGESTKIVLDNQDKGQSHNFHVKAGEDGDFETPIMDGPNKRSVSVLINTPGEYQFICDVHSQMSGTLVVSGG